MTLKADKYYQFRKADGTWSTPLLAAELLQSKKAGGMPTRTKIREYSKIIHAAQQREEQAEPARRDRSPWSLVLPIALGIIVAKVIEWVVWGVVWGAGLAWVMSRAA